MKKDKINDGTIQSLISACEDQWLSYWGAKGVECLP